MSKEDSQKNIDFSKITDGLNRFNDECQSVIDEISDLIEKREIIRRNPAPVSDIEQRLMTTIDHEINKYKREYTFTDYTRGPELSAFVDNGLFTKKIMFEGVSLNVPNVGAFLYFNYDQVKERVSDIAREIVLPDAGLPGKERINLIQEIDEQIIELEVKKDKLYADAREAGFNVTERFE